jgi:hypothetical protein
VIGTCIISITIDSRGKCKFSNIVHALYEVASVATNLVQSRVIATNREPGRVKQRFDRRGSAEDAHDGSAAAIAWFIVSVAVPPAPVVG